jgi:hypothetical protein
MSSMIKSIIFSKNRPLQLDLTLNSIYANFMCRGPISVIYKADDEYVAAYDRLKEEHYDVNFIKEDVFLLDIVLKEIKNGPGYVVFFTDDIIFYRNFCNAELIGYLDYPAISCISLRLGRNIDLRDSATRAPDNVPAYHYNETCLSWNRLSIPPGGYWAYPLSVDGHIFKKETILEITHYINNIQKLIEGGSKQSPNRFEEMMQMFFFRVGHLMICPEYSCVVNSPNNRVQDVIPNNSGTFFPYNQIDLNNLYMEGKRIEWTTIDFSDIRCPHQELKLL